MTKKREKLPSIQKVNKISKYWGLCERKPVFGVVCEQQKRRPACASVQSDQHLCFSLIGNEVSYLNLLQAKFQFSSYSLCSRGDWFESHFVGNPEDRFCCDEAHWFL